MSLETLANELLLEVFEFLTTNDRLHAFHNLNHRFSSLLSISFQTINLDMRSMSKCNFSIIYRHYLPAIVDQVVSLRLTGSADGPPQTEFFVFSDLVIRQFYCLRSLSLYHLRQGETLRNILVDLHQLPQLSHLNIIDCHLFLDHAIKLDIINGIWSLPKLTHCHLGLTFADENYFISTKVVSLSLKHLFIPNLLCRLNEMARLFNNTPNLWYFCVRVNATNELEQLSSSALSIKTLKLSWNGGPGFMTNLLKSVPNLSRLTVVTTCININGHQLEQIIITHLPKLKVFRLKMDIDLDLRFWTEEEFHRLFNTFTTSFWIDKRKWFVRCDCYPQKTRSALCLYTLPYAFDTFHIRSSGFGMWSLSTSPNIDNHCVYDCAHTLVYDSSFSDRVLSHLVFSNVCHLVINLPYNDHLFSLVPKLDRLFSLDITLYEDDISSQLQILFDRASHLHSLSINSFDRPSSFQLVIESTSASVRRIDLQGFIPSNDDFCFDEELCVQFSCSSLGINCEILSITVVNRSNIIHLVDNMANLRTLHVRCQDDQWEYGREHASTGEDELVDWLKARLPSSCTIVRDASLNCGLRLWIR
jgi:hypothetical protein